MAVSTRTSTDRFSQELIPLVLTQFDTLPNGSLSDGFNAQNLCASSFCDGFDQTTARDGHWALDIITANSATELSGTPEPGTMTLVGLGAAAFAMLRRRAE